MIQHRLYQKGEEKTNRGNAKNRENAHVSGIAIVPREDPICKAKAKRKVPFRACNDDQSMSDGHYKLCAALKETAEKPQEKISVLHNNKISDQAECFGEIS